MQNNMTDPFTTLQMRARKGNKVSCRKLAKMYETGTEIEANHEQAIYWYIRATEKNDIESILRLAQIYESGIYGSQDLKKSIYWYSLAAELKYPIFKISAKTALYFVSCLRRQIYRSENLNAF